jgi:translation initiation factor IF-1
VYVAKDTIEMDGVVTGINRGGIINVDIEVGDLTQHVLARCSGRMKKYQIKLVIGDEVKIEFSPYDLTLGRVIKRKR